MSSEGLVSPTFIPIPSEEIVPGSVGQSVASVSYTCIAVPVFVETLDTLMPSTLGEVVSTCLT